MRVDFCGLTLETPRATFCLWSLLAGSCFGASVVRGRAPTSGGWDRAGRRRNACARRRRQDAEASAHAL